MRQPDLFKAEVKPPPKPAQPVEYKVVALRECPAPEYLRSCDTPQHAAGYWRQCVSPSPHYDPDKECFVVLLLTTRKRVKGHHVVGIGLLDQVLVHAREVFRPAIVAAAHAVVVMHNHPGGDPTPSEADIRVTRDLIRAGQILRIEVLDHIIVTPFRHSSLRELGWFHP